MKALRAAKPEEAGEALRQAERTLRRATSKGVLSKKQASRRISRLAKSVHAAASG